MHVNAMRLALSSHRAIRVPPDDLGKNFAIPPRIEYLRVVQIIKPHNIQSRSFPLPVLPLLCYWFTIALLG